MASITFAADFVGYCRLIEADHEGTVSHRSAIDRFGPTTASGRSNASVASMFIESNEGLIRNDCSVWSLRNQPAVRREEDDMLG